MTGTINENATITGEDGTIYDLPIRGTSPEGDYEVLIDATRVGGRGSFSRQSIKQYVGMTVNFVVSTPGNGYNYTIIK